MTSNHEDPADLEAEALYRSLFTSDPDQVVIQTADGPRQVTDLKPGAIPQDSIEPDDALYNALFPQG